MGREIVVGLHFYQPPREAIHPELQKISTDPEHRNWTAIIEKQCYEPLAEESILKKISFDIYQSLLLQLEKINPDTASVYKSAMKENGIGESFIHPILPDLSRDDKSIVISAGVKRFYDITGKMPKIFWPPETAIDTETLEVLSENGYLGFVCAPEQLNQSDGSASDNKLTQINLSNNRQIIAYPFDRSISNGLAFDGKLNADSFVHMFVKHKLDKISGNQSLIAWTDAETFGHHYKNGDKFLKYLLESSLPGIGLYPISINDLTINRSNMPGGTIVERSAWSCPHGNLIRWNGSCDCATGHDTTWKQPFIKTMDYLNAEVSKIILQELGEKYKDLVSGEFYSLLSQPELINSPVKALVSAKISSLIAKTSCATFFSSPEVSGKINLLYAYQSLLYLKDAGLIKTSSEITGSLFEKLENIRYPHGGSALNELEKMLGL